MKNFVDSLYDYDRSGVKDKESSDEEEAAIVIENDQSKPVSRNSGEEEDLHVEVNFDEPVDLAIN